MKYNVVLTTLRNENVAKSIAKTILEKKLAACVKIFPTITSMFWWQNKIENENEVQMLFVTNNFEKLKKELKKIHPYKVPEIISLEFKKGNKEYLKWINEVTK